MWPGALKWLWGGLLPFAATLALTIIWRWLALLTIIPASIFAFGIAFYALARSNREWGTAAQGVIPLLFCFAGGWTATKVPHWFFS